ncbi:uncharacterized protein At2g39795, mitochondrial-like [Ananas comosus]|uniref:Uncharacterized protein At2g39795, mitochondrial-like n=1 Tax=Ananas comosus TaxID=4615 RepID=A0A6P5FBY3_ANACO|nr:uncharacterized protein At2g39795, mitochondrial-like [Ananas comosus]
MARFVSSSRRLLRLKTLTLTPPPPRPSSSSSSSSSSRSYISEMRRSAFKENLLRILRTEIAYESESRPPNPAAAAAARFDLFSVDDRPGEQWIRLVRKRRGGEEEVKIDATMFDGAAPAKRSGGAVEDGDARLHISLLVEVSKGEEGSGSVLQFVCSAWPDSVDVEKVFPVRRCGPAPIRPYTGPDFKELDEEMQEAVRDYLEERGVNDELAAFLHDSMANKDRTELLRWLKNVESYVKKP